ncbi:MAG: hypothetical protein AAFY56_04535 [Pseudomonadota bacterium]
MTMFGSLGDFISMAVIYVGAVIAGALCWRRDPALFRQGVGIAWRTVKGIAPMLLVAIIAAGFLEQLLPGPVIGHLIGPESGVYGVALAIAVGAITPGGPIVSFPLVVALANAGAGGPQVMAFVTGWSTIAVMRIVVFEIPVIGVQFAIRRFVTSLFIAPIVGLVALAIGVSLGR